jgi:bacillopeptidase F (M6 metalloprotease family)
MVQYNIAKEIIAEYYENTGKTLTVGVASIMKKNVNENGTLLDANGNTTQDKVVTTPIADKNLNSVMIKITGATSLWEAYSSESIYVLGYVTNGVNLEYIGFNGGEAVSSASLNNIEACLISAYLPKKGDLE